MMSEFKAAIARGDLAAVRALLPSVGERQQLKTLQKAEECKNVDLVEVLISGEFLSQRLIHVFGSLLHYALLDMNTELLDRLLVRGGEDLNAKNISGCTPLYYSNNAYTVRLLLDAGADPNAGTDAPLHHFATFALEDRLLEILPHPGVDVNVRNERFGHTPLHCAAAQHVFMFSGLRPWHRLNNVAEREGCTRCVEALLAAGADPCAVDNAGRTPLAHQNFVHSDDIEERDHSTHRITTMLVAAGDRQWPCVPTPCPGLEKALVPVWEKAPKETVDENLRQLFQRLEPAVQAWLREALRALHLAARPFKGLDEPLRMKILEMALE